MLTTEQILKNKVEYLTILTGMGVDISPLAAFLDQIQFFEAPASIQDYKAYPGGLCEHALNVYNELRQIAPVFCPDTFSEVDIIKVALLKDVYKAGLYELYYRNVKDASTGKWEQEIAYRNADKRPAYGDLGFSSYMLMKHFVEFTDEQIEAICHHTLGVETNFKCKDLYKILRQYPLVVLTHMAEVAAMYLGESDEDCGLWGRTLLQK